MDHACTLDLSDLQSEATHAVPFAPLPRCPADGKDARNSSPLYVCRYTYIIRLHSRIHEDIDTSGHRDRLNPRKARARAGRGRDQALCCTLAPA